MVCVGAGAGEHAAKRKQIINVRIVEWYNRISLDNFYFSNYSDLPGNTWLGG